MIRKEEMLDVCHDRRTDPDHPTRMRPRGSRMQLRAAKFLISLPRPTASVVCTGHMCESKRGT